MSLPVWLPGPMFLPGGLCPCSHVPSRGSLPRGLCPEESLPRGVSVQVVFVWESLSRGLCLGVSVWGYLSRSLCPGGLCLWGPPRIRKAGGTHPTGMLSQGTNGIINLAFILDNNLHHANWPIGCVPCISPLWSAGLKLPWNQVPKQDTKFWNNDGW